MRRWLKWSLLGAGIALLVAQAVPIDRSNPAAAPGQAIYAAENLPPPVRQVFQRSCNNCHSNDTSWPWYSYVAPVSWIIASDVHHARRQMNFSAWRNYPAKKREEKLEEICEQVTNGDMPDPKYLLVHRNARITSAERTAVCQWTEDARQY